MKQIYSLFATVALTASVYAQTSTTVLTEDFAAYTAGTSTNPDTQDVYLSGKNVPTFPTGTKVFQAGGLAKFGSSSAGGSMTTGALDLTSNGGNVRVSFDVKGWTSVEGSMVVTLSGATPQTIIYTATQSQDLEHVTAEFPTSGTASSTVTIATSAKRSYIDNVKIETYSVAVPALNADATDFNFNKVEINTTSDAQTINVTGENLTDAPTFEISGDDKDDFKAEGTLATDGGAINVTFAPTSEGVKNAVLTITSGSLSQTVNLTGEAFKVTLNADATDFNFDKVEVNTTSDAQTVNVTGENLTDTPTFEITGDDKDDFKAEGTLATDGGAINVTFAPTTEGVKNAVLTITSGSLSQTVNLTGEATAAAPEQATKTIVINVENIGGTEVLGTSSYDGGAERTWTTNNVNFGGKFITSNNNNQPSGAEKGTLIQAQASTGVIYNTTALPGKIVSITLKQAGAEKESVLSVGTTEQGRLVDAEAGNSTAGGTQISSSTTGWTSSDLGDNQYTYFAIRRGTGASYFSSIEIVYEVSTDPALAVNTTDLDFATVIVDNTSEAQTVNVTAENLTEAPTYEITGDDKDDFTATGDLTVEGGAINVTFAPTTKGTKNAVLTITSGDLTQTVNLTGNAEESLATLNPSKFVSLLKNTSVADVIIFTQNTKVSLVNMNGQVVKTINATANNSVNVSDLPKGMYIATAVVNGKAVAQKLIKK